MRYTTIAILTVSFIVMLPLGADTRLTGQILLDDGVDKWVVSPRLISCSACESWSHDACNAMGDATYNWAISWEVSNGMCSATCALPSDENGGTICAVTACTWRWSTGIQEGPDIFPKQARPPSESWFNGGPR